VRFSIRVNMKPEMRHQLAQLSFEEKIRKVGEHEIKRERSGR